MPRPSQIVAGILLIPYVVCGAVLCKLVLDRVHCSSMYYFSGKPGPGDPITTTITTTTTAPPPPPPPTTLATTTAKATAKATTKPTPNPAPKSDFKPSARSPAEPTQKPRPIDRLVSDTLVDSNNISVSPPQLSIDDRFCAGGYHGLLSLMATLLIGFTIIIYRLFIGIRTRSVKYVHMILHVISLILFSCGLWCIFTHEYSITYDRHNYHGVTSWVVFALYCLQFIAAAIVFTYMYPNTKLRLYMAPFHDIVGIWLFICCVACCISGKRRAQLDYFPTNQQLFYGISYVCFTCILIIILSPFFEWDMVGPL